MNTGQTVNVICLSGVLRFIFVIFIWKKTSYFTCVLFVCLTVLPCWGLLCLTRLSNYYWFVKYTAIMLAAHCVLILCSNITRGLCNIVFQGRNFVTNIEIKAAVWPLCVDASSQTKYAFVLLTIAVSYVYNLFMNLLTYFVKFWTC